jgi:cytosine deaminase
VIGAVRRAPTPVRKENTMVDGPSGGIADPVLALFETALEEARQGFAEGGIPIGAALVESDGRIVARGRNRRVQEDDAIAHGEMDCLRRAGRRRSYRSTTLYTTLSPCMMCAGTIVQFKIPKVVIGENKTFGGNEEFLRSRGVEVVVLDDGRCIELMARFKREHSDVWNEDIGEDAIA